MTAEEIIRELPKGLIKWHRFEERARALYITGYTALDGCLEEALQECGLDTKCVDAEGVCGQEGEEYSYIFIGSAIEMQKTEADIVALIQKSRVLLKKDGKLFLFTDNRMAIRYFCGDKDPFTGRNFDGIENYKRVNVIGEDSFIGRLYSKAELKAALEKAGFPFCKFYSVFPEISCPQFLFAEDYKPEEELGIRIFPQYHNPDTVFLEEERLYTSMIENGIFHAMANGFVVECCLDGRLSDAEQITISADRGKENAMYTMIRGNGKVEKRPLYREGNGKLKRLEECSRDLQNHGVNMVSAEIADGAFIMPYVQGVPLVKYFRLLAAKDKEEFLRCLDQLWKLILGSSEHMAYEDVDWEHFNPWWDEETDEKNRSRIDRSKWKNAAFGTREDKEELGPILRRGYIDLVLLNGFWADGEYVFFDQETYVEHLPAKTIMLRNIDFLYYGDSAMEQIVPRKMLMERYGIERFKEIFYAYSRHFLIKLRNDDILADYHRMRRRNEEVVHSNRQRMNYSTEEYQRMFVEIFKNIENKKLYLFGSGKFSRKFLALYKDEYTLAGILDNDETKWGTVLDGVKVMAPSVLKEMDPGTYKVIICIKNYVEVLKQIKELGARNIGIYDTNMEYPRRQKTMSAAYLPPETGSGRESKKKYHVGYVAGVFDLFHIGHLNLLQRAKEQCDYLIAGVVTDEGVRKNKGTECFIPFKERLTIVQACRYVDEAVEIPFEFFDTKDAYLRFQFDVQFSGSDYEKEPAWLKKQDYLRRHGSELVFFPYTESTSSSKLKEMIDRKLQMPPEH